MKAKNKNDLLESLLAELEPSDYKVLDKQMVSANLVTSMQMVEKLTNELCYYHGWDDNENIRYISMLNSFQLGYIMGKREERLKRKILKAHAGTF